MGKKRKQQTMQWCWYCDREFEDDKVLINHQKARHFKCDLCGKKLNTAGGLVVHFLDVHKEDIRIVPNVLPHRNSVDIEIFGMEGIPYEDLQRHLAERETKVQRQGKVDSNPDSIKAQFAAFQAMQVNPNQIVSAPIVVGTGSPSMKAPQPMMPAFPYGYPPQQQAGMAYPPYGYPGMMTGMPPSIPATTPPQVVPFGPLAGKPAVHTPVQTPTEPVTPKIVQMPLVSNDLDLNLIFEDNGFSMEETRAMLPKYRFVIESS